MPAILPSGVAVELRAKPLPLLADLGVGARLMAMRPLEPADASADSGPGQGPRPAAGRRRRVRAGLPQHRPAPARHGRLAGRRRAAHGRQFDVDAARRRRPRPASAAPTSSTATAWCSRPTCGFPACTPTRRGSSTRPRPRAAWPRSCPASTPRELQRRFETGRALRLGQAPDHARGAGGGPGARAAGRRFSLAEHRVYPKGSLASHVTGFVNIDGVGQAGIERSQQERLSAGRRARWR